MPKEVRMTIAHDLVAARLYESEEAVLSDALRHLLRARPDLRISLAVYRYQQEAISLAKAATLAGVSWPQMREILVERGITSALGAESLEEAAADAAALRDELGRQP
jgi:predicted HTH domain antitoxin